MSRWRRLLVAALLLLPGASQAQEPPSDRPAQRGGIETITVTAEKRESPLQETPIAVSAFTGEQLERLNVESSSDLAVFTPGLVSSKASNTGSSLSLFGRGIGNADNHPMVDPKVGLYVDGAYHSSGNAALFDLFDIERIEVLRGPQGTLYGRNTTGGALNIITKKPTPELGYKVSVTAGEHRQFDTKGALNLPLVGETLLSRFAFARTRRDPFYSNKRPGGDDYEDNDSKAARAALRWNALEALLADYSFEWIKTDEHNPLFMLHSTCASGCLDPDSPLFGVDTNLLLPGFASFARNEKGDTFNDGDMFNRFTIWNHSLTLEWEASDELTIKSITGWRRNSWGGENDLDGSTFNMFHSGQSSRSRNFFEEIQLLGTALDGKVEYVFGGNWYEQEAQEKNFSDQFVDCPACTGGVPTSQSSGTIFDNYAIAGFGQATIDLTPKLSATAGLRFTTERKEAIYDLCALDATRSTANRTGRDFLTCIAAFNPGPPARNIPVLVHSRRDARFDGWSPMARLNYDWTDDVMTYVTWARGYQSGGFSPRPSAAAIAATTSPFEAESLFSWEVGMKSRWLSDQIETNVAAYYNKFKNQQITTFVPGAGTTTFIDNAGQSRIRGWEIELATAPAAIPGLTVRLNHAWTNADFAEFLGTDPVTGTIVDFSEFRKFGHLPKRKWAGIVEYGFSPQSWGELVLTGVFVREGPKNWLGVPLQDAHTKSSSYTKYDARIDLNDALGMQGLRLSAIGRNITDRSYKCCQGIDFFFWQGGGFGQPRQLAVEVGYEWGGI